MSGAELTGSMPSPATILGILDEEAQRALKEAKTITVTAVDAEAPGHLGAAMTASTRKTPTGYRTTVSAPRGKKYHPPGEATVAQVVRWVNRGTGLLREGPGSKKRITSKRGVLKPMILPGGKRRRSVKGQKPNPFLPRAETRAEPEVRRAIEAGARKAADRLRRL